MQTSGVEMTCYEDLDRIVANFAAKQINLLIIVGRSGLQKSALVRSALGKQACFIENNATAFGIYCQLYRWRNAPVVIDDVDQIYADPRSVRLLKGLCQTEQVKQLSWHSRETKSKDIPDRFQTTSRVIILANDWKTSSANVAALEDRGLLIRFVPDSWEVHQRVASWFWDPDVYSFIGRFLHLIPPVSMRDYRLGFELKAAGLPWQRYLMERWGFSRQIRLAAELQESGEFSTEQEGLQAFIERCGGTAEEYHAVIEQLQAPRAPFAGPLVGRPPLSESSKNWIDELDRRYGGLGNG